jgi:peptidoglycan/xylan/chitin deacetylase (PgdA/CDA1 family)
MGAFDRASLRARLKRAVPDVIALRSLPRHAGRAVLLTFDDGPHPDVTPAVLERLESYGARAAFFVIGRRVRRAPHVLERILAGGHAVDNHSQLHRPHYVLPTRRRLRFCEYYRDVRRCQETIERASGQRPVLFRPPGGRLTPVTIAVPRLLGLRSMTWSREVEDWCFRTASDARDGGNRLAASIQPRDIVLLHDDNPCILELLDQLLPALASRRLDLTTALDSL